MRVIIILYIYILIYTQSSIKSKEKRKEKEERKMCHIIIIIIVASFYCFFHYRLCFFSFKVEKINILCIKVMSINTKQMFKHNKQKEREK